MKAFSFALSSGLALAAAVAHAAVARIGSTEYDTVVSAIQASQADDVIELLSDVSESFADTAQASFAPVTHNLTITSAGNTRREIYATNTKGYTFSVSGTATLTFSNVVVRSASRTTAAYDMFINAAGSSAKVVFDDGFLMSGVTNAGAHAVCRLTSSATLEMKPGSEVRALFANYGHLRVENGCTLNISGGTIADCYANSSSGSPIYLDRSNLNLSGGVITGCRCRTATATCAAVYLHANGNSTVNLSGGAITNNAVMGLLADSNGSVNNSKINLSGDFVIRDNARGDFAFPSDQFLDLVDDYTGFATVTNTAVAGLPTIGAEYGSGTGWKSGASNVRFRGDENYQLLNRDGTRLVWGTRPVRLGETYYPSLHEAIAAAPDTATFEILCDNPEYKAQIAVTNKNWRFVGVGGQKTLTWTKTDFPFYFYDSEIAFQDVVLTATGQISTSTISSGPKQYFINLAGGSLTLASGGAVSNVNCKAHTVLGIGWDGLAQKTREARLVLEPGSLLTNLSCNYGAIRFEGAKASLVMNGGRVTRCETRSNEGTPFCFQDGGDVVMTGGTVCDNTCKDKVKSGVFFFNNNSDAGAFRMTLAGGEIVDNDCYGVIVQNNRTERKTEAHVTLGGTMNVGAPGLCVDRTASGGGIVLSAADDYQGMCRFFVQAGVLSSPAATCVLGDVSAEALTHLSWTNAADYPDYRLATIDGLAAFLPSDLPEAEAFADYSVWSGPTGLGTDLAAAVATSGGSTVYLLKDVTLTAPIGSGSSRYTLDGRGHTITCENTCFHNTIGTRVVFKNMTVSGNRGRITVTTNGSLILADGFVFRDFAGSNNSSYASFGVEGSGVITLEDGVVIEDGLSQVGFFRVDGATARVVMNGGVIRNLAYDSLCWARNEGVVVNLRNGTFEMNGGVISNCLWNAAAATPDFTGVIHFSPTSSPKVFKMTGGSIVGNTAGVWCEAEKSTVAIEGTATIATNSVRDVAVSATDVLRQTGDFTGDVVVTAPYDGDETVFGVWEAGTGSEHFRHGRSRVGKVVNNQLVWEHLKKGLVVVFR